MATFGLTVAGGIAGSLIPGIGWILGASIGSTLGGMIDGANMPRSEVGKLADRRFGGSSYGVGIPRVWGEARVGVNIAWVAKDADGNHLIQHVESQGGKGGGSGGYDEYWYSVTLAGIVGEGRRWFPDDTYVDRPLSLVTLWANDEIQYQEGAASPLLRPDEGFIWHDGSEAGGVIPDAEMVARYGMPEEDVPALASLAKFIAPDFSCRRFGNQPPSFSAVVKTAAVSLADIVSDLLRSCGVPLAKIDVSAAMAVAVPGFVIGDDGDPQSSIETLLEWYAFDLIELDGLLRLVKRGDVPVATIPAKDLGAGAGGPGVRVKRTRINLTELPGLVKVSYYDREKAHQAGEQSDVRQSELRTQNSRSLALALSITSGEAKQGAGRLLDSAWLEVDKYDLTLMPRWMWLAPGDPILVPIKGELVRMRIVRMEIAPIGEVRLSCVGEGVEAYTQAESGSDPGSSVQPPVQEVVPSEFVAWSGREVSDAHQTSAGFYVAASGPVGWQGGRIRWSPDAGASWIDGGAITRRSAFGEATTILSASGATANVFDDANEVTVQLASSVAEIASASDSEILAGRNHAILGGEILGFGVASPNGGGEYELSHLRRGERGTEMAGHASGDLFVALTPAVARVPVAADYVGEDVLVKVVSPGEDADDVTAVTVTIAPRTPTVEEAAIATMVRPYFVAPTNLKTTTGAYGWTTIDLTGLVPATAQAVMIETRYADSGSSREVTVESRSDSSGSAYTLAYAKIQDDPDTTGMGSATVPLAASDVARSIDVRSVGGFGVVQTIRLVGYWG
ncbi:hypothetical protein EON79_04120 [bacterium]|nr:MAG: hypothetical protein EON79_04120 [bacterium]